MRVPSIGHPALLQSTSRKYSQIRQQWRRQRWQRGDRVKRDRKTNLNHPNASTTTTTTTTFVILVPDLLTQTESICLARRVESRAVRDTGEVLGLQARKYSTLEWLHDSNTKLVREFTPIVICSSWLSLPVVIVAVLLRHISDIL